MYLLLPSVPKGVYGPGYKEGTVGLLLTRPTPGMSPDFKSDT